MFQFTGQTDFCEPFEGSFAGINANLAAHITYDVSREGVWVEITNYGRRLAAAARFWIG